MQEDYFTIFTYTDAQALQDGILVDASRLYMSFHDIPINRITCNLLRVLPKHFKKKEEPDWDTISVHLGVVLASAIDSAEEGEEKGTFFILPADHTFYEKEDLWLLRNEVGGWTLMLPMDY